MEGNGHEPIPEVLQQLGDVVNGVNAKLDATNAKLDASNAKLEQTREDLKPQLDITNVKLDQTREDLGERIDAVKLEVALRAMARANACDDQELRGRVDRIEQHLGISQ